MDLSARLESARPPARPSKARDENGGVENRSSIRCGSFGEARTYAGHAISLAKNIGNTDLAKAIAERRLLYAESKPYRLPANQEK